MQQGGSWIRIQADSRGLQVFFHADVIAFPNHRAYHDGAGHTALLPRTIGIEVVILGIVVRHVDADVNQAVLTLDEPHIERAVKPDEVGEL